MLHPVEFDSEYNPTKRFTIAQIEDSEWFRNGPACADDNEVGSLMASVIRGNEAFLSRKMRDFSKLDEFIEQDKSVYLSVLSIHNWLQLELPKRQRINWKGANGELHYGDCVGTNLHSDILKVK